jgi:hypothetical protein
MSAMAKAAMPRLGAVAALQPLKIRAEWRAGPRAGKTDIVDLSPLVLSLKFYRPLREDAKLFDTLHLINKGSAVAWGEGDDIDMAATSIERLAQESMTADEFRTFIAENGMTHARAAAEFGYSRRRIEDFLSGAAPIPRVLVLACYGYLARKPAAEPVGE